MSMADAGLVEDLQSDEPQRMKNAWAAWYQRDAPTVRSALSRAGAPNVDAEGLTHDAFIAAVTRIRSRRFCYKQGNLSRYISVVALNLLRYEQRLRRATEVPFTVLRTRAEVEATETPVAPAATEPATTVEARLFDRWLAEQVRAGLAGLAPEQRQLLIGHYLAGRTSRELAAEHQIPASTLEVRLWRLRARLRRQPVLRRAWEMLAA
ncbi:MAG: sigma-70 family RNA polymerase sigma factor [Ardenticatenaceae bacterium]|nr:sigma-70 family RNA polymerase sigma factor [Ardenticatenaceae bacterium]